MDDLGKVIADKIKAVRHTTGLSQKEFGERIGYSENSIASYERGDRTPSVHALQAMIEEYEHSADFLIGTIPGTTEIDENRLETLRSIVMLAQLMPDKDLERALKHMQIDAVRDDDNSIR